MDDERDRLVALLRHKLTELDAHVVAYRRDCADEFRQFAAELLQPVSVDVAAAVAREFDSPDGARATREAYAALYPGLLDGHEVDSDGNSASPPSILSPPPPSRAHRPASPPPILYHTSGVPKDGPRRPLAATPTLASTLSSPTTGAAIEELPPLQRTSRLRENELRGVFTPPFLPLLDSSSATRWTDDAREAADPGTNKGKDSKGAEDPSQLPAASPPPPPAPPPKQKPPALKSALRKPTVRFPSRSSLSRTPPPPTSGSGSPRVPRHVRFSFGGEEVLPTASPPEAVRSDDNDLDLLWLMPDNRRNYDFSYNYSTPTPLDEAPLPPATAISISAGPSKLGMNPDSATDGSGSPPTTRPLLPGEDAAPTGGQENKSASAYKDDRQDDQVGSDDRDYDEDGFVPLARKVSSSDRLRALSKIPLEDPTMWTVVNPQADSVEMADADTAEAPSVDSLSHNTTHALRPSWHGEESSITKATTDADRDDGEDEDDEEDDFVAMKKSQRNSTLAPLTPTAAATASPSLSTNNVLEPKTPRAGSGGKPPGDVIVEMVPAEDDFFDFEQHVDDDAEGAGSGDDNDPVGYPLARVAASPRMEAVADFDDADADADAGVGAQVGAEVDADDDQSSREDATATAVTGQENDVAGLDDVVDSNGAALAINHARKASENDRDAGNGVSIRREAGPLPGSLVGSYRGRPLSMFGVVKDPRILEQAAAMGDVSSFVGSIDGRTGVDDDVALGAHSTGGAGSVSRSGRDGASVLHLLSGTPRSLTERMAMEEARAHLAVSQSPQL